MELIYSPAVAEVIIIFLNVYVPSKENLLTVQRGFIVLGVVSAFCYKDVCTLSSSLLTLVTLLFICVLHFGITRGFMSASVGRPRPRVKIRAPKCGRPNIKLVFPRFVLSNPSRGALTRHSPPTLWGGGWFVRAYEVFPVTEF